MAKPRLILGSGSPRRLELLQQINIKPDIVDSPDIDEDQLKSEKPRNYVERLALSKNQALHDKYPNDFIITGDTTVAVGRRILERAYTDEDERRFLELLSGRSHRVITAIAIKTPEGKVITRTSISRITFKQLSNSEINAYIATGDWKDKAGGYGIQSIAGSFITKINGSYSGILGLPLYETRQILIGAGYLKS